jgi:hypothetical protein
MRKATHVPSQPPRRTGKNGTNLNAKLYLSAGADHFHSAVTADIGVVANFNYRNPDPSRTLLNLLRGGAWKTAGRCMDTPPAASEGRSYRQAAHTETLLSMGEL